MPRPAMRLRIVPRFPARLQGDDGIEVTRSGGVVTIGQNWTPIQDGAPPDLANYEVLLRKPTDGSFRRSPITDAVGTIVTWSTLAGKPSTFPPSTHTHPISQVELLQASLDQKVAFSNIGNDVGDVVAFGDDGGGNARYPAGNGSLLTNVPADLNTGNYLVPKTGAVSRAYLDKAQESLSLDEFGWDRTGTVSATTAFNNAYAAAKSVGVRRLVAGSGTLRFATKPVDLDGSVEIDACGAVIIRDYNQAGSTGLFNFIGGSNDSVLRRATIKSAAGRSGGSAISIISDAVNAVSAIHLEDLWLSTDEPSPYTNTWTNTLFFDGSLKTTGAKGVRDISLRNVRPFGSSNYTVMMKSVNGLSWVGGAEFTAGGSGALTGALYVTGSVGNESNNILIAVESGYNLFFDNCNQVTFVGVWNNVTNSSTAAAVNIIGDVQGTIQWNSPGLLIHSLSRRYVRGTSGYRYLPDGRIEQWIPVSVPATTGTNFNWPVAFPTAVESVTTTLASASAGAAQLTAAPTLSGGTAYASVAGTVYVRAIGY